MKALIIRMLERGGAGAPLEKLEFHAGVNVLVGRPNTGKTKWLQMLDFAFGSEKAPHEVFGEDLAQKYDFYKVTAEIDGVPLVFERRWKETGNRGKIFANGESMGPQEFCAHLLEKLDIPLLHYPQGNPYGARTWPELSWRGLLRHIYRQQRFWTDLADNQPTSEQHACLLQFLGLAEHLYSAEYGKMVGLQKQILELQARKEQFLSMLHEVSQDILDEEDRSVAITPESINIAMSRVRDKISRAQEERDGVLSSLTERVKEEAEEEVEGTASLFEQQSEMLAQLRMKADSVREARATLQSRLDEIQGYRQSVAQEIGRLERAQVAGETLANLKVTHCPACDQPVSPKMGQDGHCYVCGRIKPENSGAGGHRIAFEMEHLRAEYGEADELLSAVQADLASHASLERSVASELRKTENLLRPSRQAAAAILPPELGILDVRLGQLGERVAQLERIRQTFTKRDELTAQIQKIEKLVAALEAQVEKQTSAVNTESASDWLSDGMNDYTNSLNRVQPGAWPQDRINVRLNERTFQIRVGSGGWRAKLGGTLTLYLLIAYQYGLLRLTKNSQCHFPGLVILDFPPVLEDGSSVHDKENFVVEPFLELLNQPEFEQTQVIAAGSSFENLAGAHRIVLERVWTEGGEMDVENIAEIPDSE